mgnify:CR=1 FL=1
MEFEKILSDKCKSVIDSWRENDIYAISFLIYSNMGETFENVENFPEFSIGYNTERFCGKAPKISEERWNYAFWSQNNQVIISADNNEMSRHLIDWYQEIGIENPGLTLENEYDEDFNYVGKGPGGYYELLMLVSRVARKLQEDGTIKSRFGEIPIIVHDLEYSWYCKNATVEANPNGQASDFITALDEVING